VGASSLVVVSLVGTQAKAQQHQDYEQYQIADKSLEAVNPGGIGNLCVEDRTEVQQVCASDWISVVRHREVVLAMDNAFGQYQVTPAGHNCVAVRIDLHSRDHKRLGPVGGPAFPWTCRPARMIVRVQLYGCPTR
jgi:hypothetical protein